ncbi:MAG: hypothetical protein QOD40_1156 [Alphaproteobacteria bacterium]|jgi:hypothetical protein|nr:hypothetical protein [Alphaproteobacteria bacterium]
MSINALANAAAARRSDVGEINSVPHGFSEIAAAATTPPDKAPPQKEKANDVNTALHVLFGYIPTEIVTLYVAVAAALQPPTTSNAGAAASAGSALAASSQAQWIAFWCFFVATPLVVWVVYATKLKTAGKPLPSTYDTWPVWEMFAALLAYCAWAFALPNTPFREFPNWYSPALASLAVLLASTILGLLAPLFQRPLGTGLPAKGAPAQLRTP